jgi:UDP-N-acetylmuramoylalanine--D-glutamate ligase
MINTDYFRNKKITVVGMARSGVAVANLLYELGAQVSLTDNKDDKARRAYLEGVSSKEIGVELGRHSEEYVKGRDLIVISPGVPPSSLPVIWAKQFKIPVIAEIELAWRLCPAQIIAVTGSSGKTTVTTLIGKVIQGSGRKAFVCGNIGNPFSAEVNKIGPQDYVVLETSSFQLEWTSGFKPNIAVMLNFSKNHLDRHADMQEYLQAKMHIFKNQKREDFLVLNQSDPVLKKLARQSKARVVFFKESGHFNPNQAAVMAVADILKIDKGVCLDVFQGFKGLEHRLEFVSQINDVKFINDSKATVAEATVWALKNICGPVILICGGRDKGVDYGLIAKPSLKKVKCAILIGESKAKIRDVLKGFLNIEEAGSLEEAVKKAFLKALPGDTVLFSPMCSSFDMFRDYEERGRFFKEAVHDLLRAHRGKVTSSLP